MSGENKHQNIKIRKKYRNRNPPKYRCCYARVGNQNKVTRGYCCTYPQNYKRRDTTHINNVISKNIETDFVLY